jgi:glycosyltransferase involved in cell wall biosynthesis
MKPENFSATFPPENCRVSIIIKALNEEKRISMAIESSLRAVSSVGGEVVLADSHSIDSTVELAQSYPIRIVQLTHPDERRCGIGPQLGYQHSRGEFVYILDGDMEMLEGFLEQALDFMASHPDTAGVGGYVVEQNKVSLEYIARGEKVMAHMKPGSVDRLDGGGLYRRSAIEAAGYFSNRNLHSYEEFDLAVRLRSLGWNLWRLPVNVANHFGHDAPPYRLLMRRWHTDYLCGLGELVRASAGQSRLRLIAQGLPEFRLYLGVVGWWAVLLSVLFWPLPGLLRLACFVTLFLLPWVLMVWRKRSLSKGIYSVVSWCFNAAGLVRGFMHKQRPATEIIASKILKEPTGFSAVSMQGLPLL